MTTHFVGGKDDTVIGILCVKVERYTFRVTDVIELPVEGTETRLNVGAQAIEYFFKLRSSHDSIYKRGVCIGRYHIYEINTIISESGTNKTNLYIKI